MKLATTVPAVPGFSQTDRLGLTAFGSVLLHMLVILGIGFTLPEFNPANPLPTLDITLVNTSSDETPEEYDFLAQANQDGGGDSEQPVIAKSPLPLNPRNESEQAPVARVASLEPNPQTESEHVLTREPEDEPRFDPEQVDRETPAVDVTTSPGLQQTSEASAERSRLSAEISRFWEEYQKRPRRKFLSARTKQDKYARYMEAWRAKVERVGNLNYPERAKREKLTGSLVMDVELNPNGSVRQTTVVKPSGIPALDDAAVQIVKLAAPYEPFPEEFRHEVDILHITRTWRFLSGDRLVSR